MKKKLAIDGDGVIFDYNSGYINLWEKTFGWRPEVKNPKATLVTEKYGVPYLTHAELDKFRDGRPSDFWATLPWLPGVEEACAILSRYYDLYCVTAIPHSATEDRRKNLQGLNFVDVIATPVGENYDREKDVSPKAGALHNLNPVAFVDDYLPFHRGVSEDIQKFLIWPDVEGDTEGIKVEIVSSLLDVAKFIERVEDGINA